MAKNVVETEGPQMTSQYGAYAMHAGLARLYARMRMHTTTRSGTHTHARTHTNQYVILIAFPSQNWFRESASVLRYSYVCLSCFTDDVSEPAVGPIFTGRMNKNLVRMTGTLFAHRANTPKARHSIRFHGESFKSRRGISVFQSVETGYGAHAASYSLCTEGAISRRLRGLEHETNH